jgi:hypothetical protein
MGGANYGCCGDRPQEKLLRVCHSDTWIDGMSSVTTRTLGIGLDSNSDITEGTNYFRGPSGNIRRVLRWLLLYIE